MTTSNDNCPKCEVGTVSQQTWTSGGRTIHGAMECEDCGWAETDGQPCEKCSVYVPLHEYCGNDRADGTSEYLCPDCYEPHETSRCGGCGRSALVDDMYIDEDGSTNLCPDCYTPEGE